MSNCFSGRIGIIGAGALGGFYGARLARAGHDVHFLMRSDYETVRENGLRVNSIDGDFSIRAEVYSSAGELGPCDLVIIGLKTTQNHALAELLAPVVGPRTLVLTLQNGLGNEEQIAEALHQQGHRGAEERILGGIAFICSNRMAPGVINHTAHGWIRLAKFRGSAEERTHAIAELFRSAGIECEVFDSLARIRWEKLVWNIPFNGLGVAAEEAHSAAVLDDDALHATARGLMEETIAAARADGVEIDPELTDRMIASTYNMGDYKSSMQIDFAQGRPLEVETILGEPLRRAQRGGIATPRLEMLYGIVRRRDHLNRLREVAGEILAERGK
jgi:2-dehydropantoate 2-reductase